MREFKNILVTGGAGFVGSNFIRYLYGRPDFKGRIVNLDALIIPGHAENLKLIEKKIDFSRYSFIRGNICNKELIKKIFIEYRIDAVVNFAAETPAENRQQIPGVLMNTNINGTVILLEAASKLWNNRDGQLFHHVSTGDAGVVKDKPDSADPGNGVNSAYSYLKSKASSNSAVMDYHRQYGVPVTVSNCVNNFGPCQAPDKPVPYMIYRMKQGAAVQIPYGDHLGRMSYVDDHSSAIWTIMKKGKTGSAYNIGSTKSRDNQEMVNMLCERLGAYMNKSGIQYRKLVTYTREIPADYNNNNVSDCGKLNDELGWKEVYGLEKGLELTVRWYFENSGWFSRVKASTGG